MGDDKTEDDKKKQQHPFGRAALPSPPSQVPQKDRQQKPGLSKNQRLWSPEGGGPPESHREIAQPPREDGQYRGDSYSKTRDYPDHPVQSRFNDRPRRPENAGDGGQAPPRRRDDRPPRPDGGTSWPQPREDRQRDQRDRPDRPPQQAGSDRPPRPRIDEARRERKGQLPPDVVTGAHAVEALARHKPARVKEIFYWGRDPRLEARIRQLVDAKGLQLLHHPPPGIDPDAPNPQGIAVRVTEFAYADLDDLVPATGANDGTLILVLDSITDPHNLGAILRSAAFFDATAVILPQDRAAEVTSLVERIAEGGSATVPVVRVVNLARTLQLLRDRGVECVGTALDGAAGDIRDHRFAAATALVLGAEGGGIRPLVRKNCDILLSLVGSTTMQSLNVSAFAALSLTLARGMQWRPAAKKPV